MRTLISIPLERSGFASVRSRGDGGAGANLVVEPIARALARRPMSQLINSSSSRGDEAVRGGLVRVLFVWELLRSLVLDGGLGLPRAMTALRSSSNML